MENPKSIILMVEELHRIETDSNVEEMEVDVYPQAVFANVTFTNGHTVRIPFPYGMDRVTAHNTLAGIARIVGRMPQLSNTVTPRTVAEKKAFEEAFDARIAKDKNK